MKNLTTLVNNYQNELVKIDQELEKMPTGTLLKRQSTFYHSQDGIDIGITKNPDLIKVLCRKKYLLARKKQIIENLKTPINKLDNKTARQLINKFSKAYQGLPQNYFYDPKIATWLSKPYRKNTLKAERIYYTHNKIEVRSKSEVLIANELERYELPYLYEVEFKVDNQWMYPDFIVKNPYNGKLVIWEHFGALHKEDYEKKMNEKMARFRKDGYVLGENLIYTFESDIEDATRIGELIEDIILK